MLRILQVLQKPQTNVLWVSSRPEVAESLSHTLRCAPATLRPLTREDQVQCLCQLWGAEYQWEATRFMNLAIDAVSDVTTESPGLFDIPLHVKMAAEAFSANNAESLLCSDTSLVFKEGPISFLNLYTFFVRRKRDIFNERHGLVNANMDNIPYKDDFYERHQACAMMILLSDGAYEEVDIHVFEEEMKAKFDLVKLDKTGFLWIDENGGPRFVHYSFVEYFAAHWLLVNIASNAAQAVLRSIHTGRNKSLLRTFFELLLNGGATLEEAKEAAGGTGSPNRKRSLLHDAVLSRDEDKMEAVLAEQNGGCAWVNDIDAGGRTALHLAVLEDVPSAVKKLLSAGCDPHQRDLLLDWSPLRYLDSAQNGGYESNYWLMESDWWTALEALLEEGADTGDLKFLGDIAAEISDIPFSDYPEDTPQLMLWWLQQGKGGCRYRKLLFQALYCSLPLTAGALLAGGVVACGGGSSHSKSPEEILKAEVQTGRSQLKDPRARCFWRSSVKVLVRLLPTWRRKTRPNTTKHPKCSRGGDHQATGRDVLVRALENDLVLIAHQFPEYYWELLDSNHVCENHKTLLHFSIQAGKLQIAAALLKEDPDTRYKLYSSWEPLHCAMGNYPWLDDDTRIAAVHLLLEYGTDINCIDDEGYTVLLRAITSACGVRVIKILIDLGGNIYFCDRERRGILHYACDADVVDLLVERGVDVNQTDSRGRAALHNTSALGHLSAVEALLQYSEPDVRDEAGATPLHLAAAKGHTAVVKLFVSRLDEKNLHVDIADDDGSTPLLYSTFPDKVRQTLYLPGPVTEKTEFARNYMDIAGLLLTKGADSKRQGSTGWSPLHHSAADNFVQMAELLIKNKASVNQRDLTGRTALHLAVQELHNEMVRFLLSHGADPSVEDVGHQRPLNIILNKEVWLRNVVEIVAHFLHTGSDPNHSDAEGSSLLHHAVLRGENDVVELLLKYGAHVDQRDSMGRTPLHLAAQYLHLRVAQSLLSHGADPLAEDKDHQQPIRYFYKNDERIGFQIVKLFLDNGSDPQHLDMEGRSLLHHAALRGEHDVVDFLLTRKVHVDQRDAEGRTALHLAAQEHDLRIAELLLSRGADPLVEDKMHQQPLNYLMKRNFKWGIEAQLVEKFLVAGADPNRLDDEGYTPMHRAATMRQYETVELLLKHHARVDILDCQGHTALQLVMRPVAENVDGVWDEERKQRIATLLVVRGNLMTNDKDEQHIQNIAT